MPARVVLGEWPDVATEAGRADVVVANHVLHNVVDLPPFLRALTAAARRGVVVEMLDQHPMAWLDPLWERFHGLRRPPPATTDDAVAVLREMGIAPEVTRLGADQPAAPGSGVGDPTAVPPARAGARGRRRAGRAHPPAHRRHPHLAAVTASSWRPTHRGGTPTRRARERRLAVPGMATRRDGNAGLAWVGAYLRRWGCGDR